MNLAGDQSPCSTAKEEPRKTSWPRPLDMFFFITSLWQPRVSADMYDSDNPSRSDDSSFKPFRAALDSSNAKDGHVMDDEKSSERPDALKTRSITQANERPLPRSRSRKCTALDFKLSFTGRKHFEQHMRTHTREKPYQCVSPRCGRSFGQESDLKRHIRKHSGERPYVCVSQTCGKSFSRSDNLKTHVKRVHAEEKRDQYASQGHMKSSTAPGRSKKLESPEHTSHQQGLSEVRGSLQTDGK